jgi:hypothetical protein
LSKIIAVCLLILGNIIAAIIVLFVFAYTIGFSISYFKNW